MNAEAQRRRVIDNQLNISAPLCLRVQSIYFLHNPVETSSRIKAAQAPNTQTAIST